MLDTVSKINFIPKDSNKIVLLQSGGLDSCVLACLYNKMDFEVHNLFIDYGQNCADKEHYQALKIIEAYGGTLHTAKIRLPWFRDSTTLVENQFVGFDPSIPVKMGAVEAKTYVPLRNHILLSIAGSLAESLEIPYVSAALDGKQDEFGHPLGGTPDKHINFITKIEDSLSEASTLRHIHNKGITLLTPLVELSKADIIDYAYNELDMDFSLSWSCYNASAEKPCGTCPSCLSRAEGFELAGVVDTSLI